MTEVRTCKDASREYNLGVTLTFSGMQESVREWAHTLPNGLPLWELEFQWIFEFSKSNLKGQNSLDWNVPYTIGKILRLRCLKWVCMIHLTTYNISYDRRKSQESKFQFDSWPLKVKKHLELHACRWCATYCWKDLDKSYNFALDFTSI